MKNLILLLLACFSLQFSFATEELDSCQDYTIRDSIAICAQEYIGTPYKWGGINPESGFDCSGFVLFVFKKFGIELPHSSRAMGSLGTEKDRTTAETGDIILFKGRNTSGIGHVGIVYNTPCNDLIFIHSSSPRSGGVIFSDLSESYYKARFVKIVDVLS
ncbi:MAG: C40 family peptidase [Flavobacteriales bacterium]|jgi:cell wall-associated NlpC family hydrolase|nr:C40 family peptidase [Flavobacteriales bacterium]